MSVAAPRDDPHGLQRFIEAQKGDYDRVLAEIRGGRKRTHWMWYIFPQIDGLGATPAAKRFAIKSLSEAHAYLEHPILGPRLIECAEAVLAIEGRTAAEIFGSPDDAKLRSCATLFGVASPPGSVFEKVLAKYYQRRPDAETLRLLRA